jgi:hypothetical protein
LLVPAAARMNESIDMDQQESLRQLVEIFTATRKKDLAKLCDAAVITMGTLVDVIMACEGGLPPWTHHISYRDFLPEHLRLSEKDHQAITKNGVGPFSPEAAKAVRKMSQTMRERRYLVGHIFYTPDHANWHFIYFDQRDISSRRNHFDGGLHIHLINHLWPQHTAQTIWSHFNTGNPQMKAALHIRCVRRENPPPWPMPGAPDDD